MNLAELNKIEGFKQLKHLHPNLEFTEVQGITEDVEGEVYLFHGQAYELVFEKDGFRLSNSLMSPLMSYEQYYSYYRFYGGLGLLDENHKIIDRFSVYVDSVLHRIGLLMGLLGYTIRKDENSVFTEDVKGSSRKPLYRVYFLPTGFFDWNEATGMSDTEVEEVLEYEVNSANAFITAFADCLDDLYFVSNEESLFAGTLTRVGTLKAFKTQYLLTPPSSIEDWKSLIYTSYFNSYVYVEAGVENDFLSYAITGGNGTEYIDLRKDFKQFLEGYYSNLG